MRTLLTPDNEIALPEPAVRQLALRPGIPMHVIVEGNQIVLQPLNATYFQTLRGLLIGEGLSIATVQDDKAAERALEEAKLNRLLPSKR